MNEPPVGVRLTNQVSSLPENTVIGTPRKLADIVVTDDALGINTVGLSGADATAFQVIGKELYLRGTTALDFESRKAYAVTVTVGDPLFAGLPAVTTQYDLLITDINEPPTLTAVTLAGARVNTAFVITYETLLSATQARDPEKSTTLLLIEAISSGSVQRWNGSKWVTVTTGATISPEQRQIGPGQRIRWTPPRNAKGVKAAFQLRASDGTFSSSNTAVVSVAIS